MRHFCTRCLIALVALQASELAAQRGRANGIGLRASYWNVGNQSVRWNLSERESTFDISGVGGWLNYFSRVSDHWYLDFNLGAIARLKGEETPGANANVEVSVLVPFLFGARYDLLPTRVSSAFQPYLAAGLGPYWNSSLTVQDEITTEEISGEAKLQLGSYAGGGLNLVMASWLAWNFELKYHFVGLRGHGDFEKISYDKSASGFEFGLGLAFMWGRKRELFRVRGVRTIVNDLYPAYLQFYNTYPLAFVTVQNLAGYPIEVNVRSVIPGYSERPKDGGFMRLAKGETKDIPVTAIFGPRLRRTTQRSAAVLDLKIEGRAGAQTQKEISAPIMIHGRNAWNGEIDKLGFFVTPEDETILRFGRAVQRAQPQSDGATVENLVLAAAVFDSLRSVQVRYQRDPNIPFYKDDRVQFAAETLSLRGGDCDDLAVLYASLLESLGIHTAFVDVQDPQKPLGHLYLMFDAGVEASQGDLISGNPKRYVARENQRGRQTLWLPIETTLIAQGFEEAWKAGALEYLQEGVLRNGLSEGWVKVIEVR
jgi:hypothetical protein